MLIDAKAGMLTHAGIRALLEKNSLLARM